MARKTTHKTNRLGLAVFFATSAAVAVTGAAGWWLGEGDAAGRAVMAVLALCAGGVVPVCAGQLGRSRAGWVMVLPMLLFMGWTAYSIEHANESLVEAPRKAAHERGQAKATDVANAAQARLTTLENKRANFVEEKVNCDPCRKTKEDAAARDKDRRVQLDKDVEAAKRDLKTAQAAVVPHKPLLDWRIVLVFGALLDLVLALGIWSLETTARKEEREHTAMRAALKAERLAREEAKKQKDAGERPNRRAKTKNDRKGEVLTRAETDALMFGRGPRLASRDGQLV